MIQRLKESLRRLPASVRKFLVLVVGGTVLLMGVAMIVLPGPAVVVIPMGLAVLSLEFVWARRLLDRAKKAFAHATHKAAKPIKSNKPVPPPEGRSLQSR